MRNRSVLLLSAGIALFGLVLHNLNVLVVSSVVADGSPPLLPALESTAATIMLYETASTVLGAGVTVLLSVRLGTAVAEARDLTAEYRPVVRATALGSLLPVAGAIAVVAVLGVVNGSPFDVSVASLLVSAGGVVNTVIEVPLLVVLGTVAGAALDAVRGGDATRSPSPGAADGGLDRRSEAD